MKIQLLSVIILLVVSCSPILSQSNAINLYINPATGRTWYDPSSAQMDTAIMQQMRASQLQLAQFNSAMTGMMVRSFIIDDAGKAKIRAGKATTRFASSVQQSIVTTARTAQDKQIAKISIQTFEDILKAKRLTANDMADAKALALVIPLAITICSNALIER